MKSCHSTQVPSDRTATITHNVNLSFEIGTSHIHSSGTSVTLHADETNETVARAPNDDGNGTSKDKSHGQNHDVRSGFPIANTNEHGIANAKRLGNECYNGEQVTKSPDCSPGSEAMRKKRSGQGHTSRKKPLAPYTHSGNHPGATAS